MIIRRFLMIFVFVTVLYGGFLRVSTAWAGELSSYRIVGISGDSEYLAFGEYGISEKNQFFSNVYIVNISVNSYVPNGILQKNYDVPPIVDQDGLHTFINTVVQHKDILNQYNINLLNTGKLIYVQLNGNKILDTLSFSDYDNDISYAIKLNQTSKVNKIKDIPESEFTLDVTINDGKTKFSSVVGALGFYRPYVTKYLIRSVYATLDNNAIIVIVEKHIKPTKGAGINVHYMVETLKWR